MSGISEKEKVAHLLRRFGLGASEAEVDYYGKGGLSSAIDKLLNYEKVEEGFNLDLQGFANPQNGVVNPKALQAWWGLRLLTTRRPLQEKMTLFWHDHFATSAAKVDVALAMYNQNEILRRNATGKFQTLLTEVSEDPAMLYWLDNHFNKKGKPNENFAREVMELFTLGIGHYSEKDIQEAARAFTGWTFGVGPLGRTLEKPVRNSKFVFRQADHDTGTKTVLGNTGDFNGEDILGILCGNPRTAIYITEKVWNWFAYADPEQTLIESLAKRFRTSGLDIKVLLRAVMESPEFYSEKSVRRVYKNPVDFCLATMRQLGVGSELSNMTDLAEMDNVARLRRLAPVAVLNQSSKSMGMELFYPPDVSGWDGGASWITSATMVERIKWADKLFAQIAPAKGAATLRFDPTRLFESAPTADQFARKFVSVFDANMPESKVRQLAVAAKTVAGDNTFDYLNMRDAALSVCRLIFGSPEFQFS